MFFQEYRSKKSIVGWMGSPLSEAFIARAMSACVRARLGRRMAPLCAGGLPLLWPLCAARRRRLRGPLCRRAPPCWASPRGPRWKEETPSSLRPRPRGQRHSYFPADISFSAAEVGAVSGVHQGLLEGHPFRTPSARCPAPCCGNPSSMHHMYWPFYRSSERAPVGPLRWAAPLSCSPFTPSLLTLSASRSVVTMTASDALTGTALQRSLRGIDGSVRTGVSREDEGPVTQLPCCVPHPGSWAIRIRGRARRPRLP